MLYIEGRAGAVGMRRQFLPSFARILLFARRPAAPFGYSPACITCLSEGMAIRGERVMAVSALCMPITVPASSDRYRLSCLSQHSPVA